MSWIKIDKRLPKIIKGEYESKEVLVTGVLTHGNPCVFIAKLKTYSDNPQTYWVDEDGRSDGYRVISWRYLPRADKN